MVEFMHSSIPNSSSPQRYTSLLTQTAIWMSSISSILCNPSWQSSEIDVLKSRPLQADLALYSLWKISMSASMPSAKDYLNIVRLSWGAAWKRNTSDRTSTSICSTWRKSPLCTTEESASNSLATSTSSLMLRYRRKEGSCYMSWTSLLVSSESYEIIIV